MSNEESVAGINVRELLEEKQRLEEENSRLKKRETKRNLEDSREYQMMRGDVPRIYGERVMRQRIQQLEEALRTIRKLAESFELYHLDMAKRPDPWMHQIRNITGATLFPTKEG